MQKKEYTLEWGGKTIKATFTDMVENANGSVLLSCGDTVVLVTAVMSKEAGNTDWFNLSVDYIEKFYASGEILGGQYMKREGKPSDEAILSGRIIDRTIRPLFPKGMNRDVQVIATVLSIDDCIDPTTLAINGASIALTVSDIPWNGPAGAIRITKKDEGLLWNTSQKVMDSGFDYDFTICGTDGLINMIESNAHEVSEDETKKVFEMAVEKMNEIEAWQKKIQGEIGKEKKNIEFPKIDQEKKALFDSEIAPKMPEYTFTNTPGKEKMEELKNIWKELLKEKYPDEENFGTEIDYYEERLDALVHEEAIKNEKRADGRGIKEVRELYAEAGGISKRLHGSGIFYRGGTRIFTALTLGGPDDTQTIDGMEVKENKHFMHHYNFPPYSTGETGRASFVSRREVGHGALVEKALEVVLPSKKDFPYTIRLVSEAFSSNGSTSQGSICTSTIALMDGGVPIKAPVAGIAMGLMYQDENNYKVLTDIQGPEDHYGDMDFKIAGTESGITAIQLDIKLDGVSPKILGEALIDAKEARLKILDVIKKEIPEPRKEISEYAPNIVTMTIDKEKIGMVIGSGGKTINGIKEKTGAEISIEDDGTIFITGKNGMSDEAKKMIEMLVFEWKVGDVTKGEVVGMKDFGAFVRLSNNQEGMVHISEIGDFRVEKVEDYLEEGQIVPVKVIKNEHGKLGLSIKQADKEFVKPKK